MKLNEAKCNYLVFTRTKENFGTRLAINDVVMNRISVTKILGVWISEDLSWNKNCQEICKKAYARLGMLTQLKYVGVSREDLLNIYILLARACGVPVGRRSGGRLATTLVATINVVIFSFSFLFSFFSFLFSSPSSTFLIEGVLGSKNLFSES